MYVCVCVCVCARRRERERKRERHTHRQRDRESHLWWPKVSELIAHNAYVLRMMNIFHPCQDLIRDSPQGPMVDELMAHIACFPVTLKQHLRGQKNRDEIAAVFNTYLAANSTYIDMVTQVG